MPHYAVKKGRTIGIFDEWTDCKESIKGFPKAEYKKFDTIEEATAYLEDKDIYFEAVKKDVKNGFAVAFCDGSFEADSGRYSYGVVAFDMELNQSEFYGNMSNPEYKDSANIAGEIFGSINAMDWALSNGHEKLKIYYDYDGIEKWITGDWKAKSNIAQMYYAIYDKKFSQVLDVTFEHVKGHSNNKYNELADELAKSALEGHKYRPIRGENWFTIRNIEISDIETILNIMKEEQDRFSFVKVESSDKNRYKLSLGQLKLCVTCYKSNGKKLLVQGRDSLLFQMFTSYLFELLGIEKVDSVLADVYKKKVDKKKTDEVFAGIVGNLPENYPNGIIVLLRQAIINLQNYIESEDYSYLAFPAFRALEGNIKYLLNMQGIKITTFEGFNVFDRNSGTGEYLLTHGLISDEIEKRKIEHQYNYYKKHRDTIFHFGDIIGKTDTTRLISDKNKADELITGCLNLINE